MSQLKGGNLLSPLFHSTSNVQYLIRFRFCALSGRSKRDHRASVFQETWCPFLV